MAISNYTELQSAVGNWLHRDDLTARIPEFIQMAESYMNDDLRLRSMIASATVTPSQSVKYVALPTGFIEAISFLDDQNVEIIQLPHDEIDLMSSLRYYSVTSRINFPVVAGSALSFTMTYYKQLDIATDTTNDVLTTYPHIYLYGSLVQAEPFLKNDGRVGTWHQMYDAAVKKANNRNSRNLTKLRTEYPIGSTFDITRGY